MQIHFKQPEIEAALALYIGAKGIDLEGKQMTVAFTAGRKRSGLSAVINIDSIHIAGFTDSTDEETEQLARPELSVVTNEAQDPVTEPEQEIEKAKTTSLFGS